MKQTSRGLAPSLNTGHNTFTGARQRLAVALVAIFIAFAGAQTAWAQNTCNVTFDISGKGTVELHWEGEWLEVTNDQTIVCSIPYDNDLTITPEYRTLIYLLNAFCATSDEPERYAALIRALNDNIDYTRRHAMHRKQKSDEPQPDGGDKE